MFGLEACGLSSLSPLSNKRTVALRAVPGFPFVVCWIDAGWRRDGELKNQVSNKRFN